MDSTNTKQDVAEAAGDNEVSEQEPKSPSQKPTKKPVHPKAKELPYNVRISEPAVNLRRGPGTNFPVIRIVKDSRTLTIVEEREGFSGKDGGDPKKLWGKLKGEPGWILLNLTKSV